MNTIRSYKERNTMVKRLISKTIPENLPVESVFYSFNENILQNIGKTSLCRWSTLLKIYEDKLLSYLILHFNKNIQIKPFDITYKHKILYIFKILILIMKYTFGHELYDFNQSIYEYTHSHDLDISYQALLFYNERFIFDEMNAQKCISDILKEHDNSTYLERDYSLTIYEEKNKILVEFAYGNDTDRKILLEIQDLLTKNTKLGVKNNIFEIQNKITNITLKIAEILKFEYYKETESQKLLALDILLTNILNTSFHSFNEKILRYGECSVDNIENQINKILNTRSFCIENIYQKLNLIIQKSIEREILLIDFNETNLNDFIKSLTNLLDTLIFSQKNHLFYRKLIEEESFNLTIINSFRFLETLRFINETRNADFAIKIFVLISKTLIKVLKNEKCFSRDLIDFIVNETLNFSLVQKPEKYKFYETDLFYELFEYYFTDEIPMSSLSFDNIYFLLKKILKVENNEYNLNMVDHIIKFYYYVIEHICNENNRKIVDLELFDIHKSAFYAKIFVKNIHKYFEDKNKFVIDIFFYYEFHLKNLLSFLTNLFNYFDINLTFQNPNCIYLLIKRPEFLFFSEAKWLIWDIVKNITIKTSPSQDVYEFFFKFLEYTLERLSTCSFDKRSCSGVNERELSKITVNKLYEICYISLLGILPRFGFPYTKLLYHILILPDTQNNSITMSKDSEYDPNILYLYYLHMKFNFIALEFFFRTVFDTFHKLSNIALKYSADNKFLEADTDSIIFKSLDLFMFVINNMKDANLLYSSSKYFLQFIEDNIKIFTATIFMDLFTNKILKYLELIAVLCDIRLFDTITSIVHKIDNKSLKSLHTNNKIEKNTLLYDFLYFSFYKMKYSGIFINVNDVYSLYNILISNINTNISKDKKFPYKKETLFGFFDIYNLIIQEDAFIYAISLIRLSEFSNLFTKMELYLNFEFKRVLDIFSDKNDTLDLNANLYNYSYLYLRCMLEDDIYVLHSLMYIIRNYSNLSESVFIYFYSRLIIREKPTNISEFLLDESELDLKRKIIIDVFNIAKNGDGFKQPISLQILTELISTFPPLIYIIDFVDLMNLFSKITVYSVFDDKILLYRLDEEFMSKLVVGIIEKLSTSNIYEIYSIMSFLYKLLLSEICCCGYTQDIFCSAQEFYDSNCEKYFLERRLRIIDKFLTLGLLNMLLSVYKKHEVLYIYTMKIIEFVINLAEDKNYIFKRKFLMNDAFVARSSSKKNIFIPNFLEESVLNTIKQIELDNDGKIKETSVVKIWHNNCSQLDFGYKARNHLPGCNYRFLYIFITSDAKIRISKYNFVIKKFASSDLFINKFGQNFDKLKFMKIISDYDFPDLFLLDLAKEVGLETFILPEPKQNYKFPPEKKYLSKSLTYYFENNTDSSSLLDEDHLISKKPSRFATILTIKQFAEIFLWLLVNNKKIYHTYSIKFLKKIADFCIRNKLIDEFYLILTKNIKSYKSEVKDEITLKKLEIIDIIFEEINFIEIFNSDFLTIEILMVIVKIFTHDNPSVGLTYDFFTLFGRAIDKCLFFESFKNLDFYDMYKLKHEDDQYIKNLYFYTGLIMAKSIMMNATLGFQFIDSFYFYLLKDKFTVEDLKLVDNEFYRNIIKSRDVKNISSLELTFSISFGNSANTLEFIPDGSNISVTNSNIEDYLQIITEFKLFKNMIVYLEELKRGFKGFEKIDVDAWISATKYSKEFHINHKVIIWFWEFIRESCVETQKRILYFVTGLEKIPIGGFDSSKFQRNPFTIESSTSINLLPRSQTCINLLFIPLYEDKETLIDKFLIAIECKEYGSI
ncbi:HECT domain-containing ubiquitin-transferase [Hamiltosporidium tvaerminnensis]|uniref:HECT-type E3 ubiquitin transferase n=1 Tax=Hamiltosporidium tvaerminnensis TaxID=1176355 RepID=A0A4Q9LXU4_9MICR|nr:HECT domain-containing ubiquitin-transferase [Hamiltosporidium tvaerminnensis]